MYTQSIARVVEENSPYSEVKRYWKQDIDTCCSAIPYVYNFIA